MKISYKKLLVLLIQRDISKVTLCKEVGIATGTMSKLNKGEEVALPILLRICDYLDYDTGDICEAVRIDTKRENIDAKEDGDIDSLFKSGGTTALILMVSGLDDFNLVCFWVGK